MNAINVTSNLHSFLRDVEYRACMHENRIDELFRVRGFHTKTPQFFLMRKTHLSARAASLLASCRSFPTFVGVARERGETDSLSRTLTAVHVRPFVREVRVSHAATSPAGYRDPAVKDKPSDWRLAAWDTRLIKTPLFLCRNDENRLCRTVSQDWLVARTVNPHSKERENRWNDRVIETAT